MSNSRIEIKEYDLKYLNLGIEFFGFYDNKSPTSALKKHDHGSCFEICYLDSGMQPYYIHNPDNEESTDMYRLYGGEVFTTYPHEVHSTGSFRELRGRLYWIMLDSQCKTLLGHSPERSQMLQDALRSLNNHILKVPQSVAARLMEAFDLMMIMNEERIFRACELLTLFIFELADCNKNLNSEKKLCNTVSSKCIEAISYIQNHLLSPDLNVNMVVEHLNYSRSYAMRSFKKEIGLPIHEYILRSKVDYACELLTMHSITETALLLNFSSSQHFSKIFKEFTGMTPTDYTKSLAPEQ
ncbi:MAG: AraC family transcriptional regulator [Eubacteriales bacterium]